MNNEKKKQNADKFIVRLPTGMREKIASISKTNHRSMNSEIVSRLEYSFEQELYSQDISSDESNPPLNGNSTAINYTNGSSDTMETIVGNETVNRAEQLLVNFYRKLPKQQQQALLAFLKLGG